MSKWPFRRKQDRISNSLSKLLLSLRKRNYNFLPILSKSPLYLSIPNKDLYNNLPWLTKPTSVHRQPMSIWGNSFKKIVFLKSRLHPPVAQIQQTGFPIRDRPGTPQIPAPLHIVSVLVNLPREKINFGRASYKVQINLIKLSLAWVRIYPLCKQNQVMNNLYKIIISRLIRGLPYKNTTRDYLQFIPLSQISIREHRSPDNYYN